MTARVVRSRLDTDTVPPEHRFALFQAAVNATHDAVRLDGDDTPFRAKLEAWLLHDMVITAGVQGASRMTRTPERLRADGFDHFTFTCLLRGSVTGTAGGPVRYGAQEVAVFDLTQPMETRIEDNENICVRLSRSAMRTAMRPLTDVHGRVLTGLAGRMVTEHLAALLRYAPTIADADVPLVIRATAAMLATCLQQPATDAGYPALRAARVRQRAIGFIDANLARPDLGPAVLCRALNVSRSNLYRAFEDSPGIAHHIRTRRLEVAYAAIRDNTDGLAMDQIARACGFTNKSHFSLAFRLQFGCSPREVRLDRHPRPDQGRLADAYDAWLAGLRQAGTATDSGLANEDA